MEERGVMVLAGNRGSKENQSHGHRQQCGHFQGWRWNHVEMGKEGINGNERRLESVYTLYNILMMYYRFVT